MDVGGLAEGRLKLARASSFRSVSAPSVGGCLSVSDDGRQLVVDGDGRQRCTELPLDSMSLPYSPLLDYRVLPVCGSMMVGEGLEDDEGKVEDDRPVTGCGGDPCISEAGEVLLPSMIANVVQHLHIDKCDFGHGGSHMHVAMGPLCDSFYPLLGTSVGRVGDGTVSEEGRVSPVSREALTPQPADGLR
ncbi:hypothetical protein Dimus_013535 [Dionaea muscipula]